MDVGTIVSWIQIAIWVVGIGLFIGRVARGEVKMHPLLTKTLASNWIIGTVIVLGFLGSGIEMYLRLYHPTVVTKVVEKPVDKIVEKLITQECPKPPVHEQRKDHPNTASRAVEQSNSGGISIQQATTGEHSPIVNSPITVGEIPKRILPQDKVSLSEFFAKGLSTATGKKITVSADQLSSPSPFVSDFYEVMSGAQWPMKENGVNQIVGFGQLGPKRFQGAVIIVRGEPLKEGEIFNTGRSDPLYYIGSALRSQEVPMLLKREPQFDPDTIGIQFEGGFPAPKQK